MVLYDKQPLQGKLLIQIRHEYSRVTKSLSIVIEHLNNKRIPDIYYVHINLKQTSE